LKGSARPAEKTTRRPRLPVRKDMVVCVAVELSEPGMEAAKYGQTAAATMPNNKCPSGVGSPLTRAIRGLAVHAMARQTQIPAMLALTAMLLRVLSRSSTGRSTGVEWRTH
tara:strand:- start:1849 stop:2181 length:333 start_codon:yes stop_codon:yes gene_type:complete